MQPYDFLMIAVMGGAIMFGLLKGFAWQVASVAAIFVSYFVARNFNEPVAQMIGGDPSWNRFLAMFILFMGSSLIIWVSFGFVRSSIEKMHLKSFDRQIGGVLGAAKGFIICTLITLFGVSLLGEGACRSICTSTSGNLIARVIGRLGGVVPEEIGKFIDPYIDKFYEEIEEHQNEIPPQNINPDLQPGGTQQPGMNQPGFQPNWGNQGMTQNTRPAERVGQLESATPGSQSNQYNGQFQYPPNNSQQTYPQPSGGQLQLPNFQMPQIDFGKAAERAAGEIFDRAIERVNGGNQ